MTEPAGKAAINCIKDTYASWINFGTNSTWHLFSCEKTSWRFVVSVSVSLSLVRSAMQKNSREKKALASAALQLLIQTVRWLQPIVGALWSRQLVRFLVYMVTIHTQQVSNSSIDHLLEYSCNAGSIRCNLSCKLACVARFPANSLSPSSACSSNVQKIRPQIKHQWCWSNKYIHRRSENTRDQQQWSDWHVFWKKKKKHPQPTMFHHSKVTASDN